MSVHYSSKTDEWETPQDLFDYLDEIFHFTLDVCATPENAKCDRFFTKDDDGFKQDWRGEVCWMNPPYGREIGLWMHKASRSGGWVYSGLPSKKISTTVMCLIPARTDTRWWWNYCLGGEIFFLKGRLKFGGAPNSAPFPSALVLFRGLEKDVRWWDWKASVRDGMSFSFNRYAK